MPHTKGPLEYHNDEDCEYGLGPYEQWLIRDLSTDRDIVAVVPKTGDEEYDDSVVFDNVRLFSAAPELLKALRDLIWQHDNNDGRFCGMAIQDARAAIAKALGEQ